MLLSLGSVVLFQRSEYRSEMIEEMLRALFRLLVKVGVRDADERGVQIDPERLRRLQHLASFTVELCESMGIKCWLHAGTLLGAWRSQRIDPWDHDVDFAMVKADEHSFREHIGNGAVSEFVRAHPQYENVTVVPHTDPSIPYHIHEKNSPLWATLFSYEILGADTDSCRIVHEFSYASSNCRNCRSRLLVDNRRMFEIPCQWVLPVSPCKIIGLWAWCPRNAKPYLEYYYGDLSVPQKWRNAESQYASTSTI